MLNADMSIDNTYDNARVVSVYLIGHYVCTSVCIYSVSVKKLGFFLI